MVVVGDLVGEGASEQAVAMGAPPNLAARLQALAQPHTVVVADNTRELAGGVFEYADQGAHDLKGFAEPVRAWVVLRTSDVESRFDAERSARLTPLVGREQEIGRLLRHWERARDGAGQVVLLSGEAGIGKSRIAETVDQRIRSEAHRRLRYQCSPYHANSALYPFIRQLERAADLERGDAAEEKWDKLDTFLATFTPRVRETAPLLAALLSERGPPRAFFPENGTACLRYRPSDPAFG